MLHLALVHNLLSAIGAAPHLSRPNLPAPAGHYPAGVQLALLPFGDQALRHFMFLERPEGMDLDDAEGLAALQTAHADREPARHRPQRPGLRDGRAPVPLDRGRLARTWPPSTGRTGCSPGRRAHRPPRRMFGWPNLLPVTGLDSACAAVEEILEQGEGPRGHWRDAHFGQFVAILDEYQQMRAANPGFDPVRPVMAANVRPHDRADDGAADHRPADRAGDRPVQRRLRDPAPALRAVLRAHQRDRRPAARCWPTRRWR